VNTREQQVAEWNRVNGDTLIPCRWAAKLSPSACRAYQTRIGRYSAGQYEGGPARRVIREDFQRCAGPAPCPHFLADSEAAGERERRSVETRAALRNRRTGVNRARELDRLTNPDVMLVEGPWKRSLVKR
jgi:hypothetical protein